MRPPAQSAPWVRRAAALAGAVGLILMGSLAPAAAFIRPVSLSATGSACPAPPGHPALGVTVTGPVMYKSPTGCPSTVTVSQVQDLGNQMVQVSWTGFTPSKGTPYSESGTLYPVEVAECAGNSPGTNGSGLNNCYYGSTGGFYYTNGKYGPGNAVYTTTSRQGTGVTDIQIETGVVNQQLNCDSTHNCSLLILPVQGGFYGDPPTIPQDCSQHKWDAGGNPSLPFQYGTAGPTLEVPGPVTGDTCSWPHAIVVPLHFAPVAQSCGFRNAAFTMVGSPLMQRAVVSWESGLCNGKHPLAYSQDTSLGEPTARGYFAQGADDVALTTDPLTGSTAHPYTYAPIGISASAIAYWMDNGTTGQPYTDLKLTPLLLTKMLTQSYQFDEACTPAELQHPVPGQVPPCDPGVLHDSQNLLSDPEFLQLNKGEASQISQNDAGYLAGIPTVMQGGSDMTWEVTRWLSSDSASTNFLAGQYDVWGQHVNTFYLGTQFPEQAFSTADPDGSPLYSYLPVFPPQLVATDQVDNWLPAYDWSAGCIPGSSPCSYTHYPVETPGVRSLTAILGEPDAAAFMLPSFKIENAAGDFVAPSNASMAAAIKNMVPNGSNGITQEYNDSSKDAAAYPLTMVVYAIVPTGGIPHAKAAAIAQWLDYVAGPGQQQGNLPGQLPPGYLPLTSGMRAQTLKAAYEVLHQTGNHSPGGGKNPGGGKSSNPGGGTSPGKKSSPGSSTGPSSGANPNGKTDAAAFSSPFSGQGRLILIIVLIVGGLLVIAGPTAMVLGKPTGRAAVIGGWRRVRSLRFIPGRKRL